MKPIFRCVALAIVMLWAGTAAALVAVKGLPDPPNRYYAHWTTRMSGIGLVIGVRHMDVGMMTPVPLDGLVNAGQSPNWRKPEPLFLPIDRIPISGDQEFSIRIMYKCLGIAGGQIQGRSSPGGLTGSGCYGFPSKMKLKAEWTFEREVPGFLVGRGKIQDKRWRSAGDFSSAGLITVIKFRLNGDEVPQRSMLNLWVVDALAGEVVLGGVEVDFVDGPLDIQKFVYD